MYLVTLFGLSLGTTKSFGSCPPVRGKSGKEGKECTFYFLFFAFHILEIEKELLEIIYMDFQKIF